MRRRDVGCSDEDSNLRRSASILWELRHKFHIFLSKCLGQDTKNYWIGGYLQILGPALTLCRKFESMSLLHTSLCKMLSTASQARLTKHYLTYLTPSSFTHTIVRFHLLTSFDQRLWQLLQHSFKRSTSISAHSLWELLQNIHISFPKCLGQNTNHYWTSEYLQMISKKELSVAICLSNSAKTMLLQKSGCTWNWITGFWRSGCGHRKRL